MVILTEIKELMLHVTIELLGASGFDWEHGMELLMHAGFECALCGNLNS